MDGRSSWRKRLAEVVIVAALAQVATDPAGGQSLLERSPNMAGGWVGLPGYFYADLPHRFVDAESGDGVDIDGSTTFVLGYGVVRALLLGIAFAPDSDVAEAGTDEWEAYGRYAVFEHARGAPVDLSVMGAYNSAAESFDGAVMAARWFGAVRLLGEARGFTRVHGGDSRAAVAAGAVVHVRPGGLPLALSADVGTLLDRDAEERVSWSAGVQFALPHTAYTFGLHASNAATTTLHGATVGGSATRYGFQLTLPTPLGGPLGLFPDRETAAEAVTGGVEPDGAVVRIPIRRYAFTPARVVVSAGTTIEWVNEDAVVHTATAENGAWDSEGIEPGGSWRARFDRPGRYPYFCAPHPYMQAMVIVR